ncbi:uncharacterized protein LOC126470364 isoform X3 [Schistocerca serialis cubense]|uniref:uncharacterized protein LOC126470364 isoform X3 n=1 Tax=Schistocerca serialis cubense TaxID=2023355 RepID=UPI00214E4029|nr:uncharacterized protein LOC126470364 isoform X3 [Schistocerca serialis cubense]
MFVNKAISITQTEMRGIRTVFNPPWRRSISGKYDIVRPYEVTAEKTVPPDIEKPEYFASSVPEVVYATETKSAVAIDKMRLSCQLAKKVLNAAIPLLKVGVTTDFIDGKLHQMIIENGAYPSPLRYHGFPKSICTSVNNVICHGIPDLRPLRDGDIINVDVTVFRGGYHGDCSATFLVGNVDEEGIHLVEGAKKCLLKGIGACGPGERFSAIAWLFFARTGLSHIQNTSLKTIIVVTTTTAGMPWAADQSRQEGELPGGEAAGGGACTTG